MSKVQRKITPTVIIEVDGDTPKEVFEGLARLEEVFMIEKCGKCGGDKIKHVCRKAQKYIFYELWCLNKDCRARFQFGESLTERGVLFPSMKDKEGKWKPDNGWSVYKPNQLAEKPEEGGVDF